MNQEKYIGMDVHQATISVAVMGGQGKLIMECLLETKAADLAPREQLNVIGHSRGGDVAIEAAREGLHIDNLITLATPKYDDLQPPAANIGKWINVTTRQDWV
jgi:hypothetical protein